MTKSLQLSIIAILAGLVLQGCGDMTSGHGSSHPSKASTPGLTASRLESSGFPGAVLTNEGLTDLARTLSAEEKSPATPFSAEPINDICVPQTECINGGSVTTIHDGYTCMIDYDQCDTGEEILDGGMTIESHPGDISGHCFDFEFDMCQTAMHEEMTGNTYCVEERYNMHRTREGAFYIYRMSGGGTEVRGYDADIRNCTVVMSIDPVLQHWDLTGQEHCDVSPAEGDW